MIKRPQSNCLICERINLIKNNKNPYFVKELKTGYVVIGDHQFFKGYSLLLCKQHKRELHELEPAFRKQFLWEMSLVAEAVNKAFKPRKLNCELLGNTDSHMHWHIFPRYKNDPLPKLPIWCTDEKVTYADSVKPSKQELGRLVKHLKNALDNTV